MGSVSILGLSNEAMIDSSLPAKHALMNSVSSFKEIPIRQSSYEDVSLD